MCIRDRDRRLHLRFGQEFVKLKQNTSVIPFIAVIDGRQKLQLKEFLRPSQIGILIAVATFWWSHRFITLGTELFLSSKFSELFA